MNYILSYSRYGIDLDVPENASKQDVVNAYLRKYGGPQGALDHFLWHLSFTKDFVPDAEIIENDDNRTDRKEITD
jgi:hypothetical protein